MSEFDTWLADNGFELDKWNSGHEWEGTARCYACREDVGTLRVEMRTLFGVTEDWAMLDNARCRVY